MRKLPPCFSLNTKELRATPGSLSNLPRHIRGTTGIRELPQLLLNPIKKKNKNRKARERAVAVARSAWEGSEAALPNPAGTSSKEL